MCNMCARDVPVQIAERDTPLKGLKRKHNLNTDPADEQKLRDVEYQPDLLAFSTQCLKITYDFCKRRYARFQDSKTFVTLKRTWQPFYMVLSTVALTLAVLCGWAVLAETSSGKHIVRIWKVLHVLSVATHIGAQIWMTLISGIVLYFSLPRHEFGRVQTALFPVYYTFNSIVSLVALVSYVKLHSVTRYRHISWAQVALLSVVFLIEACVRLRFVRPMLRSKHIKTQMEEAAGGGKEVGKLVLGELAHCPRYMRVLKAFRSLHSTVAAGTLITMGCSLYSIIILADSMCGI